MAKRNQERTDDPLTMLADVTARRFSAKASYKAMLDQRGNSLMSVSEKSGDRSKVYLSLTEKLEAAKSQLERIASVVRRPLVIWIKARGIHLIAFGTILALLEAIVNKYVFDVAVGSVGAVSYAASIFFTGMVLLLAHFAGMSIRQVWSDHRNRIIVSSLLLFIFLFAADIVLLGGITIARAAAEFENAGIGDLVGRVGDLVSLGPLQALGAAMGDNSARLLGLMNAGGILATMVLAFGSHDSDKDYDHAHRIAEKLEKQLAKVHDAYLEQRRKIIAGFAPDLLGYATNYSSANGDVIRLKTLLGRPLDNDDHFVLTDLDQMSEDAEANEHPDGGPPAPSPHEPATVHSMSAYRTGTDGT